MKFNLIGYSGHAYVVIESALSMGLKIEGYFEKEEKKSNPYQIKYIGSEETIIGDAEKIKESFFVAIGDNKLRKLIYEKFFGYTFANIIDSSAIISQTSKLNNGIYVGRNVCINALTNIGNGAIINTAAIIEHECSIGDFVHVAPGAVLCGNVKVGNNSFIGANTVIKQGIEIGDNVVIGAGSVIVKNIDNNRIAYGNPCKIIK